MTDADRPFRFGQVVLPVFLPTLLFSIGEGAIIPMIPIAADNLGATLAIAGFIAGMLMIGEVIGDIPSGWVVSRIGERNAMIWAALLAVIGLVLCVGAPGPLTLTVGVFLVGLATAVFALARHAFMTTFVPLAYRARALSSLGGTFRAGVFVGPFVSAGVVHLTNNIQNVFWVHAVCCLGAAGILLALPDPAKVFRAARPTTAPGSLSAGEELARKESTGLFQTIRHNRPVLLRMGGGAALVAALRASRQVMLPLWAVSIGISDANTALIIGVAGGVDFALFYAGGQIMDRFGRLWSALPSMLGLGIGHLVLAFTHNLQTSVIWFIATAMFLSVANGIGSGILMTLGADLAPRNDPAPFLGAYRFTGDAGSAAAPLIVSGVTAIASLPVASAVMGVLGFFGAGVLARYVPRYIPRRSGP